MIMDWLHNAAIGLIAAVWFFGSTFLLAHGVQGTWRPENKHWKAALILGAAGLFTLLVTFATLLQQHSYR